jgi:hypothetical protein
VTSTVIIAASPDRVWRNVIAFPPIDAPADAVFALVAMPLAARIDGQGAGAMRHCLFTNGQFDEPIEVWTPGRELTFGVVRQPPGIDRLVHVQRGRFLLTGNPDGTTTLEGTTWYRLDLFPSAYWRLWTQPLLHAIHMRVLEHVKRLSERPGDPIGPPTELPAWMRAADDTCPCTALSSSSATEDGRSP